MGQDLFFKRSISRSLHHIAIYGWNNLYIALTIIINLKTCHNNHSLTHWGQWAQSLEVSKIKKNNKTSKKFCHLFNYRWPKFFEVFLIFFYFWNFKWLIWARIWGCVLIYILCNDNFSRKTYWPTYQPFCNSSLINQMWNTTLFLSLMF